MTALVGWAIPHNVLVEQLGAAGLTFDEVLRGEALGHILTLTDPAGVPIQIGDHDPSLYEQ